MKSSNSVSLAPTPHFLLFGVLNINILKYLTVTGIGTAKHVSS